MNINKKNIFYSLIIVLIFSSCSQKAELNEVIVAENGYIDLSTYKFDDSISLKGEWKFRWNMEDDNITEPHYNDSNWKTLNVPGYWNSEVKKSFGYCWLRLKIKNNTQKDLGLFIKCTNTSYNLYINGKLALKNGKAGNNKDSTVAQTYPMYVSLPKTEFIYIAWKISNFDILKGGPRFSPVIDNLDDTVYSFWSSKVQDSIIIGIIIMIFAYNLIIWLCRKKEITSLYLAIACFIIVIRYLTTSRFLESIFNETNIYLFIKKAEYLTLTLAPFMFMIVVKYLFPKYMFKIPYFVLKLVLVLLSIFILVTPIKIYGRLLPVYQICILLVIIKILTTVIISIIKKIKGSVFFMMGFAVLFITAVNDILVNIFVLHNINFLQFGLLFFIINPTILLNIRFANAYKMAEHLSKNLKEEVRNQTKEIQALLKQKTNFFINLAHETKTPLTLVSNYLEKYIKEHEENNDLLILEENINKLKKDMVNFLDTDKIERNQIFYNHDQIFNLSQLVAEKNIIFRETVSWKCIELKWDIEEDIYIKADPVAIDRVLNNLLDNAVKYTDKDGKIFVSLKQAEDQIILNVTDTGIGISEHQKENIFSPHYQLSHKKRNIQGLGMGLHITNLIIKELKGSILVESKPGKGTTFTVLFCKYKQQTGEEISTDFELSEPTSNTAVNSEALKEKEHNKAKRTVFIVEDNIQMIASLKQVLEEEYNIYYGINGQDALGKLKSYPTPDIIISDIMMDVMDGYEFRENVMKIDEFKSIPFIFLTAKTGTEEKLRGLSQGAVDFICKPFEIPELKEKIKSWLLLISLKELRANVELKSKHQKRLDNFITEYGINNREKELLDYLLLGYKNTRIAEMMYISLNTVKKHIERIKEKLDVEKKEDLIRCLFDYVYR